MSHYMTIQCNVLEDVKPALVNKAVRRINEKYSVRLLKEFPELPRLGNFNAVLVHGEEPTTIRMNFKEKEDGKIGLIIGGEFYRSGFDLDGFANRIGKEYSQVKIEEQAKQKHMIPLKRTIKENGDVVLRFRVAS